MIVSSLIIALAIISGQLIRIPISTGGVTLLDVTIIIFCLIGLFKVKFHLQKPPSFISAAIIFNLIAIISLKFTPLHLSFSENLTSFLYIIRFASYILFGWLIYSRAFENFKNQIINVLIYSGVILAILGLLQFIFFPNLNFLANLGWDPHYYRTVSTFFDPNFAGAYFTLTLILLLSSLGSKNKLTPRVFYIVFTLTFIALMTTFSRSSYLMFLISGLSLSLLERSKKLIIKIVILFIILLLGFQLYTQFVSKPRNIDRGQSASFRLNTWQQGIQLFQNYPILGVGFNAYKYALKEFNLGDEQFLSSHGATSNDSSLLFVASTTGIVGGFCYLIFLTCLLKKGLKDNFLLTASILGLLVHSFFANSLFYPPIFLWIMFISINPKK